MLKNSAGLHVTPEDSISPPKTSAFQSWCPLMVEYSIKLLICGCLKERDVCFVDLILTKPSHLQSLAQASSEGATLKKEMGILDSLL